MVNILNKTNQVDKLLRGTIVAGAGLPLCPICKHFTCGISISETICTTCGGMLSKYRYDLFNPRKIIMSGVNFYYQCLVAECQNCGKWDWARPRVTARCSKCHNEVDWFIDRLVEGGKE